MAAVSRTSRVLVVDNDRKFADCLASILNEKGFDASAVYSGEEAIRSALKAPPDFITMDVMMGGIDGVDAAIAICEVLPSCRIVLISGHDDAVRRLDKACRRGHTFELLTKPIEANLLLNRLGAKEEKHSFAA